MTYRKTAGIFFTGILAVGVAALIFFSSLNYLSIPFLPNQQKSELLDGMFSPGQIDTIKNLEQSSILWGVVFLFSSLLMAAGAIGIIFYKTWARRLVIGVASFHLLVLITGGGFEPSAIPFLTVDTFFIFFLTHPRIRPVFLETQPVLPGHTGYPSINQAISMLFVLLVSMSVFEWGLQRADVSECAVSGTALVNSLSMGLVFLWALVHTRLPLKTLYPLSDFRFTIILPAALIIVGLGIISSEIGNILQMFFPIPSDISECFKNIDDGTGMGLFTLVVVAPVTEEAIFRGVILRGFLKHYSPAKAIIVSSLMFSVFHINPYQFFTTFWAGVLLAYLYFKTRSLWPSILLHAFNNFHAALFPWEIPGYNSGDPYSKIAQFQPLWFNLMGAVILIAGILFIRRINGVIEPVARETGSPAQ